MTISSDDTARIGALIPAGKLVCGLRLPIQSSPLESSDPWEAEAKPRDLEAVVRAADAAGFFSLSAADHVAIPESKAAELGTTWYEPTTTLAWIAGITQRVRVLTHALVAPYRHPLVVAKTFMTLDALSSGRAIVGLGRGDLNDEFRHLGVDHSARGDLLDDTVQVLRAAFAEEYPSVETRSWSTDSFGLAPRPVQNPLPIWIFGSSPDDVRRAAERADGWVASHTPPDQLGLQIEHLLGHRLETVGDRPIDVGALAPPIHIGHPSWDVGTDAMHGSAAGIAERLLELASTGANHLQIRFRTRSLAELLEQIELFGSDVLPRLDPSAQASEHYEEPPFVEIARVSRQMVAAMETSDDPQVWGAIGNELMLLRTLGRRTGREHKVCVAFWRDSRGHPILVGSYAGAPMHPDWYLNLVDRNTNPTVTVRTRTRTYQAFAEVLDGDEYAHLWTQLTLDRPSYRNYSARTERKFALVRLIEN